MNRDISLDFLKILSNFGNSEMVQFKDCSSLRTSANECSLL